LDKARKKWVAVYPYNTLVRRLIGNYLQAKIETKLQKTRRLNEFNQQFQDNVDRGVFKQLSREEARAWGVP
jgi:hypothetical protein